MNVVVSVVPGSMAFSRGSKTSVCTALVTAAPMFAWAGKVLRWTGLLLLVPLVQLPVLVRRSAAVQVVDDGHGDGHGFACSGWSTASVLKTLRVALSLTAVSAASPAIVGLSLIEVVTAETGIVIARLPSRCHPGRR